MDLPQASFLNAGDGRHEHPTQEFLDEFSFLEQLEWDRSSIHLALVGDLFHGRTAHSKVEGLKIYGKVKVDLIAPDEIGMPPGYVRLMHENGYEVCGGPVGHVGEARCVRGACGLCQGPTHPVSLGQLLRTPEASKGYILRACDGRPLGPVLV